MYLLVEGDDGRRSCQVLYSAIKSLVRVNHYAEQPQIKPYQVQNGHLHHALVEIRCPVLDNLDGDYLLRLQVLTLDDLAKSALSKNIQYEISVPTGEVLAKL